MFRAAMMLPSERPVWPGSRALCLILMFCAAPFTLTFSISARVRVSEEYIHTYSRDTLYIRPNNMCVCVFVAYCGIAGILFSAYMVHACIHAAIVIFALVVVCAAHVHRLTLPPDVMFAFGVW